MKRFATGLTVLLFVLGATQAAGCHKRDTLRHHYGHSEQSHRV